MRKVLIIIAVFCVFIFGAQSIHAVDNDYKNNLLKIEVSELDSTHYNIGLYTQKIYNEPVKIIQKSDTIYYFLLPETSHAITSVAPVGAVKNVLVKTYPYSGQDMNNGYTKVAIITTKPVNLTTSLRTLDATVSPRLDPARLARLDNVFARYSERLAQNNIQSPLNEFRKTTVAQKPATKSNVNIDKVASSKTNAKSLEEYQNKSNKEQAAAKQTAQTSKAQTPAKQAAPAKTTTKTTTKTKAAVPANKQTQTSTKQQVPVTQKVAQAVQPAAKQAAPAKSATTKTATQTKAAVPANKQTQTAQKAVAPAKTSSAQTKPVQQQTKATPPVAQKQASVPAQKQAQAPVQKQASAPASQPKATNPVKEQASQAQKVASAPKTAAPAPVTKQQAQQAPAVKDVEKQAVPVKTAEPAKTEAPKEVKAPAQTETKELTPEAKKAIEYEKQLQVKEPVEVTFKDENGNEMEKPAEPAKEVTAEVPEEQAQPAEAQQQQQQASNQTSAYMLLGSAFIMFLMLMAIQKSKKKKAQKVAYVPEGVPEARDVKELLRKTAEKSKEIREQNEAQNTEQASYTAETIQEEPAEMPVQQEEVAAVVDEPSINDLYYEGNEPVQENYIQEDELEAYNQENADIETQEEQTEEEQTEEEKIEAFNSYMDSITPDDEKLPLEISDETPDDTLIEQLYTPISSSLYKEDDTEAEYANDEISVEETANANNDDVATIVSSSKLTETRGLYLAKFEGETSLVGYIQDDIYVLYNFGEEEVKDTDIESSLAQENETDSLYIVKTGGKKLIVKSTPYDMSLEMEM